ncbi:hypothetical protein PHYBLDRAFT_59359 [Phycomyces blakesleeanus NRRL 1555(-)]|uniref:Uncharacterized protein n=2 Tax=Phycomyces blakesleeanus TaxID=4837 RepID=A0A162PTG1_PHYB8|nr:hypothetical protein PHYBLDRAFT_59359 [Phycomyces blakesleeanus NRRL 1555(-)]OAD75827.1 hypothetical protein PHYBLDRAFT_59359 [Phycomyces blakesleeanus NRRL 1555(-)]|eukprot:XP_018293867.1 hypothetical protein PHYBLDRAFT_59359 [Phycomyces blakesleeanus NRRL 1555(-)]
MKFLAVVSSLAAIIALATAQGTVTTYTEEGVIGGTTYDVVVLGVQETVTETVLSTITTTITTTAFSAVYNHETPLNDFLADSSLINALTADPSVYRVVTALNPHLATLL